MIEGVSAIGLTSITEMSSLGVAKANPSADIAFSEMLTDKMSSVDSKIKTADDLFIKYVSGEDVPVHDLVIAMGKAKSELKLAVEVRNKVVDAYKEITRMQV